MKNFHFVFWLLILATSCQNENPYDGHWHLIIVEDNLENSEILTDEDVRNVADYVVLDLENGKGKWNSKQNYSAGITAYLEGSNKKLSVSAPDCYFKTYNLDYANGSLFLKNEENDTVYVGHQCSEGCCDKQKDYYSEISLSINLPISKDPSKFILGPKKPSTHMAFHIGQVKEFLRGGYGSTSSRISTSNNLLSFEDIPLAIEKFKIKTPESYRQKLFYSINADKDVSLEKLIDLAAALRKNGINTIHIAVREDTNLAQEFNIMYIAYTVEDLKLTTEEMNIDEFVNSYLKRN